MALSEHTSLGVHAWESGYIVQLPYEMARLPLETWCQHQFGITPEGFGVTNVCQEFWFDEQSHALLFWMTWGT
jgi:hypothetical protein